jgi:hypothetical protein
MGENDFATNGNDGMVMFKTHVGVSVLNGVWDIPIITGMKPKRIWEIHWENAMVNAVYWF